jgi:uncharacterized protein
MTHTRRWFLRRSAAASLGFAGLASVFAHRRAFAGEAEPDPGFGPLVPDPGGLLDLPAGFSYVAMSRRGEEMDDGLLVPGQHDGMAAFPGPDGAVLLVRNHEMGPTWEDGSPFGRRRERLERLDPALVYDRGYGKTPSLGGTTTVVYDPASRRLVRHFLSLAGTELNCAGGPTPWGTWITCEETVNKKDSLRERDHGYVFEVTPSATPGLVVPRPLGALGRFRHEAIAVHPESGCVYLTEDVPDGVFYRFIPTEPGVLAKGGRLQAMVVIDSPTLDTKNWEKPLFKVGQRRRTKWVDLFNVSAPDDDLRLQAASKGAALFARCEGIWMGRGEMFFAATTGGVKRLGQVWKYTPSPAEAREGEDRQPGTLELLLEPNDSTVCNNADNLTVAPFGDLVVCEDGEKVNGLFGVTPAGKTYRIAVNRSNSSELAGAAFSPDGTVLFVNIQNPGVTLAIHGPWRRA